MGENGAGKSTLINSILGIIDANYSSLKYFGKEYKDNEKEKRRSSSYF
ncbi:MAG: ATP-binding cassette domain-containing protein [Longibaculum sp.]